jgi:hypothetical protein
VLYANNGAHEQTADKAKPDKNQYWLLNPVSSVEIYCLIVSVTSASWLQPAHVGWALYRRLVARVRPTDENCALGVEVLS